MQNETKSCLNYEGEYHRLLEINNALECKCKLLSDDLKMLQQDNERHEEQYKALENSLSEAEKEIALKNNKVYEAKVVRIVTTYLGTCLVIQIRSDDGGCCEIPDIRDFGKTVFLTKEEAEKALKERENNA